VALLRDVCGRVTRLGVAILLRDISPGGFAVESTIPFSRGMTHQFEFVSREHGRITITATTVHCGRARTPGGLAPLYVAGFSFVETDATRGAIDAFVNGLLQTAGSPVAVR